MQIQLKQLSLQLAGKALVTFESKAPENLPSNFVKIETSDKMFRVNNMTQQQLIDQLNKDDALIEQVLMDIFLKAEQSGQKLTAISEFTYQQVQKSQAELQHITQAEPA
tara:strand:+ start:1407 stop:1733 length:327 start_codon:yes stop_codon:yes gene_type:complete